MMIVLVLTYLKNLESASLKCRRIAILLPASMARGHTSAFGRQLIAHFMGRRSLTGHLY